MRRLEMTNSARERGTVGTSTGPRRTRRSLLAGFGATALVARSASALQATPTGSVQLEVTPNPVPVDAPFSMRVTGLPPGARVKVRAATRDAGAVRGAIRWLAEGTFVAGRDGSVDLGTQAPTEGTWATADPTALIWSAAPDEALVPAEGVFYSESLTPHPTMIVAEVGGAEVARVELVRDLMGPAFAQTDVKDGGLVGQFFRPDGDGPYPGVLVLGGSEGGLLPTEAARFATHGLAALALAYFGVPGLPPTLAEIPLEYVADAFAWLRSQPSVAPGPLAVVGHSRGAELALLLGATFPDQVGAVVSYVGGSIVVSSPGSFHVPAWIYQGEPVPQFYDPDTGNEAAIPVERIGGPVLLISGEADRVWPSALLSEIAMDRMRTHGHAFPHEHLRYPDAGHLILPPLAPTTWGLEANGGTAAGLAAASMDSWPHVLATLGVN